MKLLVISSSPHGKKSNTFLLAKEVLRGSSDSDTKTVIIHLRDFKINFCRHCERCHKKILHCPIKDDVPSILGKMLDADGIIIASPNYINQVTGSMKTLFDRSSHFIHCKRLADKYIAGVVTSGSGQNREVMDYIKYYANTCGAQFSGGVSSRAQVGKEKMEEAYKLGEKLASDIGEKNIYPDQKELIESAKKHFSAIIRARKNDWEQEYQYWLNKGWL